MLYSKGLINKRLIDKFKDLTFKSVVTEAFIRALPLSDLDREDKQKLSRYSFSVIESLGGYNLLDNAISTVTDPYQKSLLDEINNICVSTAQEAAKRVEKHTEEDDDKSDITDKAKLTSNERNDFYEKVKSSDIEEVSEEIKNKVIDVISEEKESYEKEKALKEEINNELHRTTDGTENLEGDDGTFDSEDDDEADMGNSNTNNLEGDFGGDNNDGPTPDTSNLEGDNMSLDSLIDIVSNNKFDPKEHKSVFSVLQSKAVESLLHLNDNYESIHTELMKDLTLDFYKQTPVVESLVEANSVIDNLANYMEKPQLSTLTSANMIMENALVNTIGAYTMIETLNSLNLIAPSVHNVKDFVLSDRSYESFANTKAQSVDKFVKESFITLEKDIRKSHSIKELNNYHVAIENFINTLERKEDTSNMVSEFTSLMSVVDRKIGNIVKESAIGDIDFNTIQVDRDISSLNGIYNILSKKPNADRLRFLPVSESMVDIKVIDRYGNVVGDSVLPIECDYGSLNRTMESYLKDIIPETKFKNSKLNLFMRRDGRYDINLK